MRGRFALHAEILGRVNDSMPEICLPKTIHDDSRGRGRFLVHQPFCESEARWSGELRFGAPIIGLRGRYAAHWSASVGVGQRMQVSRHAGSYRLDRLEPIAPLEHAR